MKPGPKPQPQGIRAQRGAVHSKRENNLPAPAAAVAAADTPAAKPAESAPPVWLKAEGLRIWKRLTPRLLQANLLKDTDRETFARYCRNFARWLKMQKELDKFGETYESESAHGKLRRTTPAFMIADRLERMLLATEDRFGLNPAERQRLMMARAQGAAGGLFGGDMPAQGGARRGDDPAAAPAPAAEPEEDPIGSLAVH